MTAVRMTHPTLPGQTAEVPEQSFPHHERAGWQRVVEDTENLVAGTDADDAVADEDVDDSSATGDQPVVEPRDESERDERE